MEAGTGWSTESWLVVAVLGLVFAVIMLSKSIAAMQVTTTRDRREDRQASEKRGEDREIRADTERRETRDDKRREDLP